MSKGVIYILTNPSFREYVKIGYADNIDARLQQLNRSECIPYAFRVYATYEVDERLKDLRVHEMIDRINPNLRSIETVDGKKRVREFYIMPPEDAYLIFKTIAEISGQMDRLHLYVMNEEQREAEETAQEVEEESRERKTPFSFDMVGIKTGEKVVFSCRGNVHSGEEFEVYDKKSIMVDGKPRSLSSVATELTCSKHGVAGPMYFKYNGKWLNEIRAEAEGRTTWKRVSDAWIFPCNLKSYDIFGAFEKFNRIEWKQTTNVSAGDTVYIYVGGKCGCVMYKTFVVESDLFGKGSIDDDEFIREPSSPEDGRYMILELVEKYPEGKFPLNELKAHGLGSVQWKSRLTPKLQEYLER